MAKFTKGQLVVFDERIFEIQNIREKNDGFCYDLKLLANIERYNGAICNHFDSPKDVDESKLQTFVYKAPRYRLGDRRTYGVIYLIIFTQDHKYIYNLAEKVIDGHIGEGSEVIGAKESDI